MYLKCACRLHVTNVATVASRLARSVACDRMKTSTAGSTGTAVSTATRDSRLPQTCDAISLSTRGCGSLFAFIVATRLVRLETWSATASHLNASTTMVESAKICETNAAWTLISRSGRVRWHDRLSVLPWVVIRLKPLYWFNCCLSCTNASIG